MKWQVLMAVLISPFSPVALVALVFLLDLYLILSRRLGEVTRMHPYYRHFVIGEGFVGLATVVQIMRTAAYLSHMPEVAFLLSPVFSVFAFHLPFLIGIVIGILIAWRYWSWLLTGE